MQHITLIQNEHLFSLEFHKYSNQQRNTTHWPEIQRVDGQYAISTPLHVSRASSNQWPSIVDKQGFTKGIEEKVE